MRTLSWEIIWHDESSIKDQDDVARGIFSEAEDIQWLCGQGYAPVLLHYDDPENQLRRYILSITVREFDLTMLMLLFPLSEHLMEI